jgi:hypothetical protein
MNCPKCGKPLPGGASFCMHCGQMLAGGMPQPVQAPAGMPQRTGAMPAYAPAMPLPDSTRRRNTWLAIAISAALLLLLFFGLKAGGVLKFGAKAPDMATLNASGQTNGDLLQTAGKGSNPTLQSSRLTMPDDIRNWLAHLEKCEMKKRALTKKQAEEMTDMIGDLKGAGGLTVDDVNAWSDPDSTTLPVIDKVSSIARELQPAWTDLKQYFDSYPPPEECKPIAAAFDDGLQSIPDNMEQLNKIVSNLDMSKSQDDAKNAREQAREVSRDHRRRIDEPFSRTDQLVGQVCDKYQTRKWFNIDAHGGNMGILGF